VLFQAEHTDDDRLRRQRAVSQGYRYFAAATIVMSVIVAYAGAYVRHTGAELACTGWPTCNGEVVPSFSGLEGIQTWHRLAALVISVMLVALLVWSYRLRAERPDLLVLAGAAIVLVLVQSAIGGIVVYSGLQLLATLAHAGVMALLFVVLCEITRSVWPERIRHRETRTQPAIATQPTGD
jgi:cytochrome c oxidase assembly protein subunit 15